MRIYFRYIVYLYVFIGNSLSFAGAYEDFMTAVTFNQPDVIASLLARGLDPNTPNDRGEAGLLIAIQSNAPQAAMVLAKHPKTNLNTTNPLGETPLMLAAIHNRLEVAQVLIQQGADVNKPGWTPLHYAASRGHRDMMRLLLDNDAYIDSESDNGTTPLMMAAFSESALAVKLLLEEGADPTLVNHANASALDIALSKNREQSAFYLRAFTQSWFIQNPVKE